MIDVSLEYTAFTCALLSAWLYGNKYDYKGPVDGIIASLVFIVFGLYSGIYAAAITNVFFVIINFRNLRKIIMKDEDRIKGKIKTFFNDLADRAHGASFSAGWWHDLETGEPVDRDKVVPTKLLLIISEVTEAMEGHRKDLMDDKLPHRPMIECELADAVIRIGDLAGALQLDVGGAIAEKMEFNKTRPDHKLENRRKHTGKKY